MIAAAIFFAAASSLSADEKGSWFADPQEAVAAATANDRRILILFTDPEHCPPCKRFERETLSRSEFEAFAKESLIRLKIPCSLNSGSPVDPRLAPIARLLEVDAFPTWWLLDAQLIPLATGGYIRGGPKRFIKTLESTKSNPRIAKLGEILKAEIDQIQD